MSDYQLGSVGAGNMAEAILRSVVRSGLLNALDVIASDISAERGQFLATELGIAATTDNEKPAACPRVLLAVKPQTIDGVLEEIAPAIDADAIVISIAAGISTAWIDASLGGRGHVVRVMPNTPMLVGAGISAVAPGPRATDEDVEWTRKLFAASGQALVVDEAMMDAVTAVSGSGPAYFFYLVEAMIAAGIAEGLPEEVARELAVSTCAGAGKMLLETGEAPEVLRDRVTSPGGTTERAVEILDTAGVKDTFTKAIRAAAERSRELGA